MPESAVKRSIAVSLILAIVAFYVVWRLRQPEHLAAAPHEHDTSVEPARQERPAQVARGKSGTQGSFSNKEYMLLRRRYKSPAKTANGPLVGAPLELLAKNTKRLLYQRQMWPYVKAILYGNTAALRNALESDRLTPNADVYLQWPTDANVSLLDLAIEAGQRDVIDILLENDADVNPTESEYIVNGERANFMAPLPEAAARGEDDVVRLLLAHGANIEQRNNVGNNTNTALAEAVNNLQVSTSYLLLSHGAEISSALKPGGTVPEILVKFNPPPNMVAMRELLIANGARMPAGQ